MDENKIKADIEVDEEDLKGTTLFLFGRPETNKITEQFKDAFPIKFQKDKFTWGGTTYDQPTMGVAQIVENPLDPQHLMILFSGLSADATTQFSYLHTHDDEISYVILDRDKELDSGYWEEYDSNLIWIFD